MARVKRSFVCSSCERPAGQWTGRCAACGSWGTVAEQPVAVAGRAARGGHHQAVVATLAAHVGEDERISTGFAGVDRVLGGGLVRAAAVLLAGAPGIGKSTLLLQLASRLTGAGYPCLLASGEEARGQVSARARRLGIDGSGLFFVSGRVLTEVVDAAVTERPAVLILDSIHTVRDPANESLPGGVGQVRACADALIGLAKEEGIIVILVGHVTKDGDVAGPRTLEHAVDTVLTFEGDPRSGLRVLAGGKNRFGAEGEVAWFEMTPEGLVETDATPRLAGAGPETGSATAITLAGKRAFALDVQALVVPTEGPPRRQVAGLDPRRFHIVAAVADHALSLKLSRAELYGASSGGLRLDDPGVDLAIAAALASAGTGRPPPAETGFIGEIALTGSIRPVGGMDHRLSAARAAGLTSVVIPAGGVGLDRLPPGVRVIPAGHVREALASRSGKRSPQNDRGPDQRF